MWKYVPDERYGKVMNIMKLFGITNNATLPHMHRKILSAPLGFPEYGNPYWTEHHLTHNSYDNSSLVLQKINKMKLSAKCPVAIVLPAEGEAWDLCLKILVPGYKKPIHIFVDNKAVEESLDSADRVPFNISSNINPGEDPGVECLPLYGTQYTHTENVMVDRKIVYIYARTHDIASFKSGNAIHLGRDDCFNFLGPLSDFYVTARSTSAV